MKIKSFNLILIFTILLFAVVLTPSFAHAYMAEFEWESVSGAEGYVIEISSTPDFRNVAVTEQVKTEKFKWKNFKLGNYYWRVAGRDSSGDIGLFSEVAYVDLQKIPTKPIRPQLPPPPWVDKEQIAKEAADKVAAAEKLAAFRAAKAQKEKDEAEKAARKKEEDQKALDEKTRDEQEAADRIKFANDPWNFKLEGGGHGTFSYFKGSDFNAKDIGAVAGDFRFTVAPPEHAFRFWKAELEFHLLALKANPATTFPFQDKLSTSTLRSTFIKNDSYGFVVNQYLTFKRNDLESLGFIKLYGVGYMKQWLNTSESSETRKRVSLVFGQIYGVDSSYQKTWFFNFRGHDNLLSLSVEGRLGGGITLNKDLWLDTSGYLWLGIRW